MVAPRTPSILSDEELGNLANTLPTQPNAQAWANAAFNVTGNPPVKLPPTPITVSSTAPDTVGPGTPRSIASIKSKLLRPATTSHFYASIGGAPAPVMALLGNTNQEKLNLLCAETVLPGSNLTTWKVNNDFTGATETYAYRRLFDDRINLNFYVDADNYLPIRFFEKWISYIMGEDIDPFADGSGPTTNKVPSIMSGTYNYRSRYPGYSSGDDGHYMAHQGFEITKFERDYENSLTYRFVNSYPLAINSMPISYDGSQLLKCSVSMSYLRYVVIQPKDEETAPVPTPLPSDPVGNNPTKDAKAEWLWKTRNSPAAKSGAFSDDYRWNKHLENQSWRKSHGRSYSHGEFIK